VIEKFDYYTRKQFSEKLKTYAEASSNVRDVSPIVKKGENLSFYIHTELPGDYVDNANKIYLVIIPLNKDEKLRVKTFEGDKQVMEVSLEPKGEKAVDSVLMNFIEATELYDDNVIQFITDHYKEIHKPEDIKKIIKTLINYAPDKK
jgi:hypothetical protein